MLRIEQPAKLKLYIPVTYGSMDPTAEPTLEVQNGQSIVGDAIAAGGVAANAMDGYAKHPLTIDTNAEPAELITGTDSDMSGAGNWGVAAGGAGVVTVNYDSGDEGFEDTMRIEAGDTINEGAQLTIQGGALTVNKKYILEFDYKFINTRDLTITSLTTVRFDSPGGQEPTGLEIAPGIGRWAHYRTEITMAVASGRLQLYVNRTANAGHADNEMLVTNVTLRESGWRIDLETTERVDVDALIIDSHNLRKAYSASVADMIRLFYHTSDAFASATEIIPSKIITGLLGKRRARLSLNGVTNRIVIENSDLLNFGSDMSFSLVLIVKTSSTANGAIIAKGSEGAGGRRYKLVSFGATKLLLELDDDVALIEVSADSINDGEWHTTIATIDRNETELASIYIDGLLNGTPVDISGLGNINDVTKKLAIGISSNNLSSQPLDGDIPLISLWNRALSSTEAAAFAADPFNYIIPNADRWVPPRRNMISEPGAEATLSALNLQSIDASNGAMARDNTEAHSGAWSNQYTGDGITNGVHYALLDLRLASTEYSLVDGANYYFECWVYVPAGNTDIETMGIQIGGLGYMVGGTTTTKGSWVRLGVTFTYIQGTAVFISIGEYASSTTTEKFYIDDMVLYRHGLQIDGGIEVWTGNNPDNWKDYGTPTITDETTIIHEGRHSCKVVADAQYDGIEANDSIVHIVGKRYRATVWIYGDASMGIIAEMYNASGSFRLTSGGESGQIIPAAWTKVSVEYTAIYATYDFQVLAGGSGTFYVDDFLFEQIGCIVEYRPEGIDLDDTDWHPTARRDDQGVNDYPVVTEDSLVGAIIGCDYKDVPEDATEFTLIDFAEINTANLYLEIDALGKIADADGKLGLVAWCKSMTLDIEAASGAMGYSGIITKETDAGHILAEKKYDRRPSWTIKPNDLDIDDWETLQELLDLVNGSLFPVWISTNPTEDEPIYWRARLQRDPQWLAKTDAYPWTAPLNLIAEV